MGMFIVLAAMAVGIIVGYLIRSRKRITALAERFTLWAIYLLLFLLGLAIGLNDLIVKNLPSLGLKALIITIGGVLGSIILSGLAYYLWFKPKKAKHEGKS